MPSWRMSIFSERTYSVQRRDQDLKIFGAYGLIINAVETKIQNHDLSPPI